MANPVVQLSREDLIDHIAEMLNCSKTSAKDHVINTLEGIRGMLCKSANGSSAVTLTIRDFGKFSVTKTKAREGRNPKTGETITIPASRRIAFSPATTLRADIKAIK